MQTAANVATAVMAGLLLWQLSTNEFERERERSLKLVNAWNDDGHADRFATVRAIIERRYVESGLDQMRGLDREDLARANANLGETMAIEALAGTTAAANPDQQGGIRDAYISDVDRLIVFFERMEICLAADLCDVAVLAAFFRETVESSWEYFEGHARVRRRSGYPEFGNRVPDLIARFAALQETI